MRALRRVVVALLLLLLSCPLVSAQSGDSQCVKSQVWELVSKYKDEKGVMAMEGDKGVMLQTVKMMLRKELGAEFANAITAFAILFNKDASAECANNIANDIARITSPLLKIDISGRLKSGEDADGYVCLSPDQTKITDLLIVLKTTSSQLIYIKGEFDAEDAKAMK